MEEIEPNPENTQKAPPQKISKEHGKSITKLLEINTEFDENISFSHFCSTYRKFCLTLLINCWQLLLILLLIIIILLFLMFFLSFNNLLNF